MYEFTVKFKTKEEMLRYLSAVDEQEREGCDVEVADPAPAVTTAPEVKAPTKKVAKKKTAKKVGPAVAEPAVVEPEIVQEPATKVSPGQAAFNRDSCLSGISGAIAQLQADGVENTDLANIIANIFSGLGQAQCKIGELDDSTLINFKIAFDQAVSEAGNSADTATDGSFI